MKSDRQVFVFIIALCLVCGALLAMVTFYLQETQNSAKEFDRNVQMLVAAKILSPKNHFQILQKDLKFETACFDKETQSLIPHLESVKATPEEIKVISKARIRPLLADEKGNITTFKNENLSLADYLSKHKKEGYADLQLKLFYLILPNDPKLSQLSDEELTDKTYLAESFVFPVAGFGLWAPIYGYLVVAADGKTVIGTTWYEHGETPGLGANITEGWWQNQFLGKNLFQESPSSSTNFATAPLGITVVKGKVKDLNYSKTKTKNCVDGMSGATCTGDGVTAAFKNSLEPYRNLITNIISEKKL